MWICVWAGSGAHEETQPAAFRLCRNPAASALAGWEALREENFAETCFVTLLGLGNGGREEEDRQISGLEKFFYTTKVQKWSFADGHCRLRGVQKGKENLSPPGKVEASLRWRY